MTFSPVLTADFVNWDDPDYIYENEALLNFSWSDLGNSVKAVFAQRLTGIYTPLTTMSFAVEKSVYGIDNPSFLHACNLLLHLFVVLLVFLLSKRLGLSDVAAIIVTVLMAIHPMRVESVAWITERKDVMYGILFLTTLLYYLRIREKKKAYQSPIIWVLFLMTLLVKVLAVTIPLVLILVDYLEDKRLSRERLIAIMPMILFSLIYGLLGYFIASEENYSEVPTSILQWVTNFSYSSFAFLQYLVKFVVPYEMLPIYPYPISPRWHHYLSFVGPLLYFLFMIYCFTKRYVVTLFGLIFFLFNVMFTLQVIPVGQAFMADRFTYIAYFGLFYIVGFHLDRLTAVKNNGIFYLSVTPWILIFCYLTYNQSKVWHNSETLWLHQLRYKPSTESGLLNLATYYKDNGETEKNIQYLTSLLSYHPDNVSAYNELGMYHAQFNDVENSLKAIDYYTQAIEVDSSYTGVYTNRGVVYGRLQKFDLALTDLNQAITLDSAFEDAHLNKAVIHNSLGQYEHSISCLYNYLNLNPEDADKWIVKGQIERSIGRYEESLQSIDQGIILRPNNGLYIFERAHTYYEMGLLDSAKESVRQSQEYDYMGQQQLAQEILKN